jgi:hypothetical protein
MKIIKGNACLISLFFSFFLDVGVTSKSNINSLQTSHLFSGKGLFLFDVN